MTRGELIEFVKALERLPPIGGTFLYEDPKAKKAR